LANNAKILWALLANIQKATLDVLTTLLPVRLWTKYWYNFNF